MALTTVSRWAPQPRSPRSIEAIETREASFRFVADQTLLECRGIAEVVPNSCRGAELVAQVERQLLQVRDARRAPAICVGALPFDPEANASRLFVPAEASVHPLHLGAPERPAAPSHHPAPAQLYLRSDRAGFEQAVHRALQHLESEQVEKVVLARAAECTLPVRIPPKQLLQQLARQNPRGYAFSLKLDEPADGSEPTHWTGASPELLLQRSGRYVITNPLAGTIRRSGDPREDEERRAKLMASSKDGREHRIVVEKIREALAPYCRSLSVPACPSILETPTLFHLSSLIVGELREDPPSSLELALALHPTPAVCGTPTDRARNLLRELEGFDRGFFAGLVGWCDSTGDGRWALSLRCGELRGRRARLFAGAGIVKGSAPKRELDETEAKLGAMLLALSSCSMDAASAERGTP